MKTTKYLLLSVFITLLSFSCVSCTDDDQPTESAPFLGSWISFDGNYSFTFYAEGDGYFFSNNSLTETNFTWSYDDYDLYLTTDSGNSINYEWTLTADNNELQLYNLSTFDTIYLQKE